MKKFDLVIKDGIIVTAADVFNGDIAIKGGKISAIGENLAQYGTEILNADGKYLFPGGIDVHTHLDMPLGATVTQDDFATGTIAAACGGTTTIIDFAIQGKGQTLAATAQIWREKAAGKAVVDYGFHIAITDMNEDILAEMPAMIAKGYPSFKLFMTYDGLRVNDDVLLKALLQTKAHGGLVCVHAENYYIIDYLVKEFAATGKAEPKYHALSRPPLAEGEATGRAVKLARLAEAPLYIVHLSCREALAEVARAREEGFPVMAETCPQYLLLSYDNYEEPGFEGAKYVMSPPLRPRDNQPVLWDGLISGKLQAVATDHCPFNFKGQKEMGRKFFGKIPNGAPGIESRMALLYSEGVGRGKITLQKFVEITATNPAKIFGLYPQKGDLAVGSDADIIIFDPELKVTIGRSVLHENVDYTPYEGFKVKGFPVATIARGKVIVERGQFLGRPGSGCFLERKSPVVL